MNLEVFKFADAELKVICEQPDKILLVMKPICDALSLDWHSQHRNISDDPVLNSVVRKIRTTGADGKNYEMVCIPLDYLNGWLFKISANRYKGERRELIIRYQKECYRTLAERFGLSSQSPVGFKSTTRLQFQAAVEQYAMRDTERKIEKIRKKAKNWGITDESEFIALVKIALSQSPVGSESFPIHPATIARAMAKMLRS